ncbi:hypothetical protein GCM10027447_15040 [Glycomyces halotolerans]
MSNSPEASPTPDPERDEPAPEPRETGPSAAQPAMRTAAPPPPQRPAPGYAGAPRPPSRLPGRIELYWNVPEKGAGQALIALVAGTALFAGWAVFHSEGVGIGLAITGVMSVAIPVAFAGPVGLWTRLPGAALVAALWSVAAVRDAGWVVALCSVTALLLTPIALSPPRRFTGMLTSLFMHLEGLGETFAWSRRGGRSAEEGGGNGIRNLRVAAITVALLLVFGGLFAAADANFARALGALSPDIHPVTLVLRLMVAGVAFPIFLLWAFMAVARPRFDPEERPGHREVSRFEIAVPLGALNLLFGGFIASQLQVYFGGEDYVLETAGLTFAEYARTGFWQLSVVAVLSLCVIAVAGWLAPKRARADRWVVRVLLAGLCSMSLVVVASAMFRMREYFETFGLTRLRMWVFTVEIWLAVLFVLVLVCCWKLRALWLPRAILVSGVLTLLGLAAVDPDGFIARYNIERFEQTGKLDLAYLEDLSADAVPELMALPEEQRRCAMHRGRHGSDERPALAWNLGHARAAELWSRPGDLASGHCPDHIGPGYTDERTEGTAGASEASEIAGEPAPEEPKSTEPPPDAEFFGLGSCTDLELDAAERMFGRSAKGDYGVERDNSASGGTASNAEWVDPGEPYGFVDCGFHGPGTRYLLIEARGWLTEAEAMSFFGADREQAAAEPYESELVDAGYIDADAYKYMVVIDHLTFEVSVMDAAGSEITDVAIDLVEHQLWSRYLESS